MRSRIKLLIIVSICALRPWLLVLEKTEYLSNTYTHTTSEGPLRGRRGNVTKMVGLLTRQSWLLSAETKAQEPFFLFAKCAPSLTLATVISQQLPLSTNFFDDRHFLHCVCFSPGSGLSVPVRACMHACVRACMCWSPPETWANTWWGWAQEGLVIKNEAALGLWQVLLHKYRMK